MRPKLELTPEQHDGLSKAVFNARGGDDAKTIRVDRKALATLLIDHTRLIKHHRGEIDGHI